MTDGLIVTRGDVPVTEDADVLAVLPFFARGSDPAPIRDALVAAIRVILTTYQDAAAYAASQSDVLSATGPYLDALLGPTTKRNVNEEDEDYRARGLSLQDVVTPAAIVAAVNSIIAPTTCTYLEPSLDRMFLGDGTQVWHSFVGAAPQYLDRYYPNDAAANGGIVRPNVDPGLGYLFSDGNGRIFILRIPDISGLDTSIQLVYDGTVLGPTSLAVPEMGGATPPATATPPGQLGSNLGGTGLYLFDSGTPSSRYFAYDNTTDSTRTYELIVATVDRLKGSSFRWGLYVKT